MKSNQIRNWTIENSERNTKNKFTQININIKHRTKLTLCRRKLIVSNIITPLECSVSVTRFAVCFLLLNHGQKQQKKKQQIKIIVLLLVFSQQQFDLRVYRLMNLSMLRLDSHYFVQWLIVIIRMYNLFTGKQVVMLILCVFCIRWGFFYYKYI